MEEKFRAQCGETMVGLFFVFFLLYGWFSCFHSTWRGFFPFPRPLLFFANAGRRTEIWTKVENGLCLLRRMMYYPEKGTGVFYAVELESTYIVKLGRYNGKYLSRIVSIIEVWICSIQRIVIIETTRFWCISARRVDVLVSRWEQMKLKRSYLSSRWKMHLASQWHEKIQITSLLRITHPWTELLQ